VKMRLSPSIILRAGLSRAGAPRSGLFRTAVSRAGEGKGAAWAPLAGLALALAAWTLLTSPAVGLNPILEVFSPARALEALNRVVQQQRTWTHILVSLRRVGVGLAIAFLAGVPAGLLIGRLRWLERASSGAIQFVRMISPISWMPIAVMVLGIGDAPIYFLLAVSAVWPILLSTAEGVRRVDRRWIEMARSLGASSAEILRHVVIPAVASHVVTGLRLGLGVAWIVLVPAEMLGVRAGLGYAILDARDRLAYPEVMAIILVIGFIGWSMDALIRRIQAQRWRVS